MSTIAEVKPKNIPSLPAENVDFRRFDRPAALTPQTRETQPEKKRVLAMFCFEGPDTAVGRFVRKTARELAALRIPVHIFSRQSFEMESPGVQLHPVGACTEPDLLGQVNEFTRRACNAFLSEFQTSSSHVTLMGYEWSSIQAVTLLHGIKNVGAILSLHSLERQRSNLGSELGKWIEENELAGLREAKLIVTHDAATAAVARHCVPDCAERLVDACPQIPMEGFQFNLDPAEVKARFQVGPVDPTILYVGDLDERYGPDMLMKAMPTVLRQYPQARCILVGDGQLLWPLRVYSRYLLLDHAVRLAGHLADQALYELIHAADMIVVPSVEQTPWWPIEAAWAAVRPVVATSEAAPSLLQHKHNCIVTEPDENSLAEGIEYLLSDLQFGTTLGRRGRDELEDRYRENKLLAHIQEAMGMESLLQKSPCHAEV
ncbi:MAG: glycosyltransferase family 4 protein [Pirellulales bacterium]|nr:glycosyltransferase family 4 protein [Pirellulales bacterium]